VGVSLLITQVCLLAMIICVGVALWSIHKTVLGLYTALRNVSHALELVIEHLKLEVPEEK
jgi:hypothetical protein